MPRIVSTGSFCLLALGLCGCTSFFTAQAIESFNAGLAAGKLTDLQTATSEEFRHRALRISEAVDSLAVLPLPREEGEVKEVEEIGPDERLVTVEVGEPPRTVQYRLKRELVGAEKKNRKWLVDDVILTQARAGGQPPLTKSVSEQMDLLLTVQEFLKFWRDGSRDETLARLHPDLKVELEQLAPTHLAQLTELMLADIKLSEFRPEARIQTNRATVSLPRQTGKLVLELVREEEPTPRWLIQDAVIHSSRGREPESAAHLARCVRQATRFLRAYEAQDREGLRASCSEAFYTQALEASDLTSVPLPIPQLLTSRFELEEQDSHVDLLFDVGDDTYLLAMTRERPDVAVLPSQKSTEPLCHVDELTIYEKGGAQIKPLSVLFTAQAVVEVFAESLASRDLPMLTQLSTRELSQQVWERLAAPDLLKGLPLDVIPNAPPHVVATVFQGPVTEVTVTQGARALTYVLHSSGGRPQVDDVRFGANNRPNSLKVTLGVLAPIYNFAWAWKRSEVETLKQNSSDSLRRVVWLRTDRVPDLSVDLERFIPGTLPRVEEFGSDLKVILGTPEHGLEAQLVTEGNQLMVEGLHLIGSEFPESQMDVVIAMRKWVNDESAKPTPRTAHTAAPKSRSSLMSPLAIRPTAKNPPPLRGAAESLPERKAPPAGALPGVAPQREVSPAAANLPLLQQPIAIPGA